MPSFKNINFAISDQVAEGDQSRLKTLRAVSIGSAAGIGWGATPMRVEVNDEYIASAKGVADDLSTQSAEAASRLQLQTYLEDAGNEWMAELTSPQSGELVPDLQLSSISEAPSIGCTSAVYQQSSDKIPIFGARVAVDIDAANKSLLAINGKVVSLPDKSPIAELSPAAALDKLIAWSGQHDVAADPAHRQSLAPVLEWYLDETNEVWHLAYHFSAMSLAPRQEPIDDADDPFPELGHMCLGESPRSQQGLYDYFVDAHSGDVVFWFSSTPCADIPVAMNGIDTVAQPRDFFGRQAPGGVFALSDPLRNVETYDYNGGDLDARPLPPLPGTPITSPTAAMGNAHPAAVSAHYHARIVFDFFNDVLKRKGIDDKGMKLVSVVNAYAGRNNPSPTDWGNAVWWQGKMWYGNVAGTSYARFLDVIAHELAHGVTASTSNLVYRGVPGALNESFSDFFGVVVANWYPGQPNALSSWNWEIGSGLGRTGGPIRDFSDPARTGQPVHWNQYRPLPATRDNGGVHIYSGIHNKALYHLLTDADAAGNPLIPTAEAVLLVYYTLTRLTPTSDFHDSRRTLESVVRVYHAGNPALMAQRLAAVASAFGKVGL